MDESLVFDKVCRSCSKEKQNLLNMFSTDEDEPSLAEKFASCTSICTNLGDLLPQHICYSCTKKLDAAYQFYTQSIQSNDAFLNIMKKSLKQISVVTAIKDEENTFVMLDENDPECSYQELTYSTELEIGANSQEENLLSSEGESQAKSVVAEESVHSGSEDGSSPLFNIEKLNSEPKEFPCEICEKEFFTHRALTLHMKIAHKYNSERKEEELLAVEEYVKCKQCGKRIQSSIYENHWKLHTIRELECPTCNKKFPNNKMLKLHEKYHSTHVFKCRIEGCDSIYRHKYKFSNHLNIAHGMSSGKCRLQEIKLCEITEV